MSLNNAFVGSDGLNINFTDDSNGQISVLHTIFTTKGLSITGDVRVSIRSCEFKSITDGVNTNAIHVKNCSTVLIWNCVIDKVSVGETDTHYGRGIFIENCGKGGNLELIGCRISEVAYNAIQIDSSNFNDIIIDSNIISTWDSDNTGSTSESGLYAGGRAVRINVSADQPLTFISILNNTFTKTYNNNKFVDGLGTTNTTGYDNGNVLKITVSDKSIANVTLDENKHNGSDLLSTDRNYVILPPSSPGVTFETVSDSKLYGQTVSELTDGLNISKVYSYDNVPLSDYIYDVTGALNYINSYSGFSSLSAMQSGYYLPVKMNLPGGIDADKLSITIVGKETKKLVLDDSDKVTLKNGYLNLVLFVTGECQSFEVIVDFDGDGISYAASTYILSLPWLKFNGGIKSAPLADQPDNGPVNPITLPGTYEAYLECGYDDVAIIHLIAGGVPEHYNGKHIKGYWVGVAIPVPSSISKENITSAKYYFGTTLSNSSSLSAFSADDFESDLYGDDINYVCFYIDVQSSSDIKQYIIIDWDGNGASEPVKYYVDLRDVICDNGECVVTYYDNGSYVSSVSIDYGFKLTKPSDPIKSGYNFAGWYVDEELTTAYDFSKNVYNNLNLYAKWEIKPSGSGGGVPVTPPVTPDTPKEPVIPDSNGNAEIKVDDKKAEELVHEAVSSGSNTVEIVNKDSIEGTLTSVTVSVSDLETISKTIENNQNIDSVSIATSEGEVIIEKEVLAGIIENTDAGSIVFEVIDAKDRLNEEQKKTVGDNPVYDINIIAGSEKVTDFNGKSIIISLPYKLKAGEDPNNIVVYHLKDDGTVEKMDGTYKEGVVSFETDHLSKFIIAYEAQEPVNPDNPDGPSNKDKNDNTLYYAIAAIVVILIIVALAYYFLKKKQ